MRASCCTAVAMVLAFSAAAQQFQKKLSIQLDPGTLPKQVFWVDADNDSLLDIILTDTSQNQLSIVGFKNLIQGPVQKMTVSSSGYLSGTVIPTDFNRDNKIDLVISGVTASHANSTQALINQGGFNFQFLPAPLAAISASKIAFFDLNSDGQKDAVLIKNTGSFTLLRNNHQNFAVAFDSAHLLVQDFAVFDFDGNGFNDIAVSGKAQNGKIFLTVLEFENNFDTLRTIHITPPVSGRIETGDLDHDGFFDIIVSGQNSSGALVTQTFLNKKTQFIAGQTTQGLKNADMTIADLDSDGKADRSFLGQDNLNTTLNWIKTFSGDSIVLPSAHVTHQVFGDYDRDGDLDLLQVTDTLSLIIWENHDSIRNIGPGTPYNAVGVQLFTRVFAFWQKPGDDHTPTPALTYDLAISTGTQTIVSGEFDLKLLDRLLVTHGNQGTNNFALVRANSVNSFEVQAIDNSYTTLSPGRVSGSGLCFGSVQSCTTISTQTISVCDSATVKLSSGKADALWFSFSQGFLGTFDTLSLNPVATDTIFSFTPQSTFSCNDIHVYLLKVSSTDTVRISKNITGCLNEQVKLTVDSEWSSVVWKNSLLAILGSGDSLGYALTKNEVVTATAKNGHGCSLIQTDVLQISLPKLTLNGEDFKITLGQSVQLIVSGGVSYLWTPATGLDHNNIPNPNASPSITTNYTVTLTDSVGCTAQATVRVEVTASAFIPTLFTPNGDGKNDELKIYGLTNPKEFKLTIFNREGAVVYETTDWSAASGQGWNGTRNGVLQPSGLYYWKVEGSLDQGGFLQLNGKSKGSVLLVR